MLLPGSKGWINKYFSLVENKEIRLNFELVSAISPQEHLHYLSCKTGIVFGYPICFVFFNKQDFNKWTDAEKLKVLLFETLLLVYIQKHGVSDTLKEDFTNKLIEYYSAYNTKNIQDLLLFWVKEDKYAKIENILSKRVDVSTSIFDSRRWFDTMNNSLIYLDVILFDRYLNCDDKTVLNTYSEYAYNVLIAIILAAKSDGEIDEKEKVIFNAFLNAANLEGEFKEKATQCLKSNVSFDYFTNLIHSNKLFSRYLMDVSLLTIYGNQEVEPTEIDSIQHLLDVTGFEEDEVEESLATVEHFILNSDIDINFLSNKNTYEKAYDKITSRWTKILLRNKDKLAKELSESKELIGLVKKSATQELTAEEKEKVKTQFFDVARSVPALAIFMLPGGALLLPLILKIIPDLIPSSFRDNEVQ